MPMLNQALAVTVYAMVLPPISTGSTRLQKLVPYALSRSFAARQQPRGQSANRVAVLYA